MKLQILILSAGIGWRIKSQEPRSLININEKSLIERQVEELSKLGNKMTTEIFLSAGYKIDKVKKATKNLPISVIECPDYLETGQIESIRICLDQMINVNNLLILHGDMLFKWNTSKVNFENSFSMYEDQSMLRDKEVGVNHSDGVLNKLFYGLNPKWAQFAFFTGEELRLLKQVCNSSKKYFFTHEVINKVIDAGGQFYSERFNGKLFEIDKMKDIKDANFNC